MKFFKLAPIVVMVLLLASVLAPITAAIPKETSQNQIQLVEPDPEIWYCDMRVGKTKTFKIPSWFTEVHTTVYYDPEYLKLEKAEPGLDIFHGPSYNYELKALKQGQTKLELGYIVPPPDVPDPSDFSIESEHVKYRTYHITIY